MEKQPELHTDDLDDLEFSDITFVKLLEEELPKFSQSLSDLNTKVILKRSRCLRLCIDDDARKVYLNRQHDKFFNLISDIEKPKLNILLLIINHFEDVFKEKVETNLKNIKYHTFVDNFINDIKENHKLYLSSVYEILVFKKKKTEDYYLKMLLAYFSLNDIKRMLKNPIIIEQTESFNYENLVITNPKGTEKIVMLQKLGVLDFLKVKEPFNTSTNSLASVLSTITGINQTSIYPMIQTIFNPKNNQKNNPLNSKNTVNKVVQTLNEIGYTNNK